MKILISVGNWNPRNYVGAVEAAGGEAVASYLPQPGEEYAGLVLAGGIDVEPTRYGQEDWGCTGVDPARDEAELALLDWFAQRGKPILCICRGHQIVNVWAGGTLLQDMGEELDPIHGGDEDTVHPVTAEEGSLLCRLYGPTVSTNSNHHQCVDRLGEGFRVTARSETGVVEAMEHDTLPILAFQFHPERMTGYHARPEVVDGGAIFDYFMELCRKAQN